MSNGKNNDEVEAEIEAAYEKGDVATEAPIPNDGYHFPQAHGEWGLFTLSPEEWMRYRHPTEKTGGR